MLRSILPLNMDQEDDFLISFNELDPLVAFPLQSDNPPTQNPPVCYMDNVPPATAGRSITFPGSDFGLAAGEDRSFFFRPEEAVSATK